MRRLFLLLIPPAEKNLNLYTPLIMLDIRIRYLNGDTKTLLTSIIPLVFVFLVTAKLSCAQFDTARIARDLKVGSYYLSRPENLSKDLDSAHYFFIQALYLSRSNNSDKWTNLSLEWLGDYYLELNNLDSGKACFQNVIDYYHRRGQIADEARALKWMGDCITPYRSHSAPEKVKCLESAYKLFWSIKDTLNALESLKAAADAHLYEPNLDLSEKELLTVASIYRAIHFRNIHFTYDLLKDVAELKGDLVKEVMYAMEMVRSVDSSGLKNREDSMQAGRLYYYAGISYGHAAMWDRAVYFVWKGWNFLQNTEYDEEYFGIVARLGLYLVQIDSSQEALHFVQTAAQRRHLSESFDIARISSVLGNCYWALGEIKKAGAEFLISTRILEKNNLDLEDPRILQPEQDMMILIGDFCLFTHNYDKANFYANRLPRNYTYLTTLVQRTRIELFRSRVDSAQGRYHSALKHFATYQLMNDSLFGIQQTIQIQELQTRHTLDMKDNDIHLKSANINLLTKENELQQMQAGKSRTLRNMMGIALLFLVILVAMVYNRYRVKQMRNRQLELKQNEIATKNHQLEHLLQENEWLLQEVHHRVKNNLHTVTSLLTSQMESTEIGPAVEAIRESRQRIEAIAMIHQRLYNSNNYSSIMLPAYVADLVEHLREAFNPGSRIVFSLCIEPIVLEISAALPAALILNEAISNALKHAFPQNLQGTIIVNVARVSENKVMLEVKDDGIGFSETSVSSKSFGIRLIRGLVSDISGESQIFNDNGTTVRVFFCIDGLLGKQK